MPTIKFVLDHPNAITPTRGTDRAQCIDLYAAESITVHPQQTVVVNLGIKAVLPEGYGLEFRERSGLASKGIVIGAGVIDEDYHGTLRAVVRYMASRMDDPLSSLKPFEIYAGDKIVQAELVKRIPIEVSLISVNEFDEITKDSERGEKGFGSTG